MGEKIKHPELILSRMWWMQHYVKVQDLINNINIHQTCPYTKPRVRTPTSGPLKANVVQPVEENMDWA
eukprot:9560163-Prorocentrum_lima.AAC.1